MTIIDKLISEGIAKNSFQASHIANGLHLYELRTDEERLVRARLYRDWRNSKAFKGTKECYEKARKGEPAPAVLIEEARHGKESKMLLRVRFYANAKDPRPVNWPVKYPYWVTGFSGDGKKSTIVSYADSEKYILKNWPEAKDIDAEEVGGFVFNDRFPKPDWFSE